MIDWQDVFSNALWIVGLAIALATFSYASWQASTQSHKLSEIINQSGYRYFLSAAALLFCAGMALTAASSVLAILWVVLGVGAVILLLFNFPQHGKA